MYTLSGQTPLYLNEADSAWDLCQSAGVRQELSAFGYLEESGT